jgi:hypothetical protein
MLWFLRSLSFLGDRSLLATRQGDGRGRSRVPELPDFGSSTSSSERVSPSCCMRMSWDCGKVDIAQQQEDGWVRLIKVYARPGTRTVVDLIPKAASLAV